MKRFFASVVALGLVTSVASATPITPSIDAHLITFNTAVTYDANGAGVDYLTATSSDANGGEATTYYSQWPVPVSPEALYYSTVAGSAFGAEVDLAVQFTSSTQDPADAPFPTFSIAGTGSNAGADFTVTGRMDTIPGGENIALWEVDLSYVTISGYAGFGNYLFEGLGTVLGGFLADEAGVIGSQAVIRGYVTMPSMPFAPGYSPSDVLGGNQVHQGFYAAQSGLGEVPEGIVPEPSSVLLMLFGGAAVGLAALRRRRA